MKHIVMWSLKEGGTPAGLATAQEFKRRIEALREVVPGILALEVGIDINRTPDAFDVVLYSEFTTAEALAAYGVHPEHQKVVAWFGSARLERRVVDYEV